MLVGITYDLREDYLAEGYSEEETAEFDRIDTIDAIEDVLRNLGCETVRLGNIRSLTRRLAMGERWDLVFNIAEGLNGFGREAAVPALLEAYGIPYTFSDPLVNSLTLHKEMTKRVVRQLGFPTADFAVAQSSADLKMVDLPFPLFLKPVAEGTGKGITAASKVVDSESLQTVGERLLQLFKQPVLVETFLPGREVTVGIIGSGDRTEAIGVVEIILRDNAENEVYSYVNKERCELLVEYRPVNDELARSASTLAVEIWKKLGCRDAGRIDFRADADGIPNFLEVNPLAGLNPEHSDLPIICTAQEIPYATLIRRIMEEACLRAGLNAPWQAVRALRV
ncbi:MAG: ATP-grasp domain-containing protein [Syntrophotaleaceae bacterium]